MLIRDHNLSCRRVDKYNNFIYPASFNKHRDMFSTLIMFYICAKKANILDAQCYFKYISSFSYLVFRCKNKIKMCT